MRGAQLLTLSGFAIAAPLYDMLGRNPGFFSRHHAGAMELVSFAFIVLVVPPLLLLLIEAISLVVGGQNVFEGIHLGIVGALGMTLFLPIAKHLTTGSALAIGTAALFGASLAIAFARYELGRRFVTWASAGSIAFLALFLLTSPAAGVIRSGAVVPIGQRLTFEKTPRIVVLRMDEFPLPTLLRPDGTIDADRFPNFYAFSQRATWYRNATTPDDGTRYAVPAMLSGVRSPLWSDLVPAHHPRSLYTALGGRYKFRGGTEGICPRPVCGRGSGPASGDLSARIGVVRRLARDSAVVFALVVTPPSLSHVLPAPEGLGLDTGTGGAVNLPKTGVGRTSEPDARWVRARGQISAIERGDQPTVDMVSVVLPHRPWTLLPTGKTTPCPTGMSQPCARTVRGHAQFQGCVPLTMPTSYKRVPLTLCSGTCWRVYVKRRCIQTPLSSS